MKEIKNPTTEQIKEAMDIVNASEPGGVCITGDRYALTHLHGIFNDGMSHGKQTVRAIRYISIYGSIGRVHYVLKDMPMFPKESIIKAGMTPLAESEIPNHFDNIETVIHYND